PLAERHAHQPPHAGGYAKAARPSIAWPAWCSGKLAKLGQVCRLEEKLDLPTARAYPPANRVRFFAIVGLLPHPLQQSPHRVPGGRGARLADEQHGRVGPASLLRDDLTGDRGFTAVFAGRLHGVASRGPRGMAKLPTQRRVSEASRNPSQRGEFMPSEAERHPQQPAHAELAASSKWRKSRGGSAEAAGSRQTPAGPHSDTDVSPCR